MSMMNELIAWIHDDGFELDWQAVPEKLDERQVQLQQRLADDFPGPDMFLLRLGASDPRVNLSPSLQVLRQIAAAFIAALTHDPAIEFTRDRTEAVLADQMAMGLAADAPWLPGGYSPTAAWVQSVWRQLQAAFAEQIRSFAGPVESWLNRLNPELHAADRICFHLVENRDSEWPFAFLATCASQDAATGKPRQVPLFQALQEMARSGADARNAARTTGEQLRLLAAVHKASGQSPLIRQWLDTGDLFQPLRLNAHEAWDFLKEIPVFESCGIVCRIPKWWQNRHRTARLSMTVGEKPESRFGLNALLDFRLEAVLNGEPLTREEMRAIAKGSAGLVMIKGQWIEADPEQLARLLAVFEQFEGDGPNPGISVLDALRLQMRPESAPGIAGTDTAGQLDIAQGTWLRTCLERLARPEHLPAVDPGPDFHALLRPYQETGLRWLREMADTRMGACLADDMGLGKTIQVIALMNALKHQGTPHILIVLPATLIANWTHEISRFAPSLRCQVLHPSAISLASVDADEDALLSGNDVLITTYGLVERIGWLKSVAWDLLVIDEAQAIKNPAARQTRAVKCLQARCRLALTGTPIENRLSDLWSLFDFLNKGLLGTPAEFTAFTKRLKDHPEGYGRLRQMVSPFLLRRVKTDPSVISDLPEKVEAKVYASLTRKQAALYQATVDQLAQRLAAGADGIERRGLVLAALLHLKQICNHPDLYHGEPGFPEQDSGKFEQLREICETIRDRHERVLVFTQFREMCEPLRQFLASVFGQDGLVLHGQVPVAKRRAIVDRFQDHAYIPFLVLSLKAGGTGLNLTAASHVIHFDRWWNPAVENQATDRAFRIGQKQCVIVHAFVTASTVEEKIDSLIESKKQLAADVIPDRQESFVTEMDDRQLLELLRMEA